LTSTQFSSDKYEPSSDMKNFNWNAEEYEKYSSEQKKWAKELIEKLNLKENDSVLDLGCGDGKITAEIASRLPNGFVTGVDNSTSMINRAKSKYPAEKYPNLSFHLMDAKALTFNNQFDIIFSNAALHWVYDHRKVLNGIYKGLKPEGRILIQMGGKGNASAAFEIIEEMTSLSKWNPYLKDFQSPYHFYSDEVYKELLPDAGFHPQRIELIKKDMMHEGKKGFEGFIRTTWLPATEKIPENIREKFISEAADLYMKKYPPDQNGKVHIAMLRLEIEAIKNNRL
jgi:trans-aconitate methyltransferase